MSMLLIPFVASFSSAAVMVFAVSSIVFFLAKIILLRGFGLEASPVNRPFFFIALFSAISISQTVNFASSMQGMWKLFLMWSIYIVLSHQIKTARYALAVTGAVLFGLLLTSFDGIWQLYFGKDLYRGFDYAIQEGMFLPRISASFPHTNIFAAYLILFLPLALSLFLHFMKIQFKRLIFLIIFILGSFCLFFTFGRGAAIGLLTAILFIAILKRSKAAFLFLMAAIIIAPIIMPAPIKKWAREAGPIRYIILNPERIGDYRNAMNMIKHNWLLGVGVNTYVLNKDKYKIRDGASDIGNAGYSHNIYMQMAAEIGIFGLISFLFLIFGLFRFSLKKLPKIKDPLFKSITVGLLAGIIAFLVNGFTETVLYYPKVAVLFWYEVGLLLGVLKVSEPKETAVCK